MGGFDVSIKVHSMSELMAVAASLEGASYVVDFKRPKVLEMTALYVTQVTARPGCHPRHQVCGLYRDGKVFISRWGERTTRGWGNGHTANGCEEREAGRWTEDEW